MRIQTIQITNLGGLKAFSATLPAVCLITGAHGSGKSSLESSLMYALGRRPLAQKGSRSVQHDPGILHGTADKGEITITFDGGEIEFLRARVTPDSTERKVKMRGAKKWEDAGLIIDDITNALAYNPMAFRDLEPKERLEAFLRASPVEISREEIITAVGCDVEGLPEKPGLDTINQTYDTVFKARTAENVAADTQGKHADQLEKALPPAGGGDYTAEVSSLREDKGTLEASESQEIARIGNEFQAAKDTAATVRRGDESAIDKVLRASTDDLDVKIKDLEKQIRVLENEKTNAKEVAAGKKHGLISVESASIEVARIKANAEVSEIRTHNAPQHARLTADIAIAGERVRSSAHAEGTRVAAGVARAEANDHLAKSRALTEALARLTALKASVGSRMKVPGVTIASPREGQPVDLCRDEDGALVPFSRWNDAARDQFCLKMAILFRGPCGIICVDNMANWSPARQESIIQTCRKYAVSAGMQFLLGRASDDGGLVIQDVTLDAAVTEPTA